MFQEKRMGPPRKQQRRGVMIALLASAFVAACVEDAGKSTTPLDRSAASAVRVSAQDLPPHPSDDFAKAIHGFGGVFKERGKLVLYVTDMHTKSGARAVAARVWRKRARARIDIEVRQGRYDFTDLKRWKQAIRASMGGQVDIAGSAIDERGNAILFDVTSATARDVVSALAARLGVPPGALEVRVVAPHRLAADLNDRVRPLEGGLMIQTPFTGGGGGVSYISICTYGVNATRNGTRYMIMNSHCTQDAQYYGLGGMPTGAATVYQAQVASSSRIGTEDTDPPFDQNSTACPAGATCRYSDAALVQLTTSDAYVLGGVEGTTGGPNYSSLSGPTTIDPAWHINLAGTISPIVGDSVEKVGRVSGWTGGTVGSVCYDYEYVYTFGRNVVLCSVGVFAGVQEGDSGSPVFMYYGNEYWLDGILFGASAGNDQFFFAKWGDVNTELGGGLSP